MAELVSAGVNEPTTIAGRPGTSPIGTYSPNTGSVGNTNSTYAPAAFTSGIAEPTVASYTLQNTDYQGIVFFDTASPIAVTLNSAVNTNFTCAILNNGSGIMTLTPTLGYLVNGAADLVLAAGQGAIVFFASREWKAFIGTTVIQVVPATFAAVLHEWLNSYDAVTGLFTATQPDFTDISGNLATSQLPTAGLSVTITTAALTPGGTQGSMEFTAGLLTAQTPAT